MTQRATDTTADEDAPPPRRRPRVICHMLAFAEGRRQYAAVHAAYAPDGGSAAGSPRRRTTSAGTTEGEGVRPWRLALEGAERRADDVLWLRYRVDAGVEDRRA